jgi:hypothetical protein
MLLACLLAGWGNACAAEELTNSAGIDRTLVLDVSTMPIAAGKVTLTVGKLQRTNGVYSGTYKISVVPYFYKNEKGVITITASDESLATLAAGKPATVTGTATTVGKTGRTRRIDATATPVDADHGKLKLWFMAGKKQMTFDPAYHFETNPAPTIIVATTTNLNSPGTNGVAVSEAKP